MSPFYFLKITLSKITDCNDVWYVYNSEKNDIDGLQI